MRGRPVLLRPRHGAGRATGRIDAADPDQLDNRYGDRSCAALQRRLEDAMQHLLAERGDPFLPAAHYVEQYGFTVDERGAVPYSP